MKKPDGRPYAYYGFIDEVSRNSELAQNRSAHLANGTAVAGAEALSRRQLPFKLTQVWIMKGNSNEVAAMC